MNGQPLSKQSTRLWCRAAGLWLPGRVRRILELSGMSPQPVLPGLRPTPGDLVAAWGHSPLAPKAEAFAAQHGLPLIRIEDAFLRSLAPGRAGRRGDGPLGLLIDRRGGVHFDPHLPSDLEHLLATAPLDDTALLDRAREGMARLREGDLSKYNLHDPDLAPPPPGYVLIIDQTREDASLRLSGATEGLFKEMLFRARDDHPGARIVIRSHPETVQGLRRGHYGPEDLQPGEMLLSAAVGPRALLEGAIAVYTISSQMGFEAVLAGHRPVVLGRPFYAGWGLTQDQGGPLPRRHRNLTRVQLFAGAMLLAPVWYDPCRDRLCSFEEALDQLEAEVRALREDRRGYVALGMRLWKRGALQSFFGREKPVIFAGDEQAALKRAKRDNRDLLVWAAAGAPPALPEGLRLRRVEDGLIRSRGLGADLVPPLSLIADGRGISFDPGGPSDLEALLAWKLRPGQRLRASRLIRDLREGGVTKYNLSGPMPEVPEGHRILVPGQVEDDASLRLGGSAIRSNLGLLRSVREQNPTAVILWKAHPDVVAGLRPGAVPAEEVAALADACLDDSSAHDALSLADEVWTMTSGTGFEALLRGIPVTCLGMPFYAGWGLTRDLVPPPPRRRAGVEIAGVEIEDLAWAALIGYPRYLDPITRRPCPPEVVVERLRDGRVLPRSALLRALAKAQGLAANYAWIWRRG
ncbi:capsular polysaccharide biosynthesis protein [Falsigemmobacter intermedius]|uniref:Capsular polysaccharide biosynthesis protein n=2 Tax=Falsigemmobacter intermedius TaxID=1553448 RepID=A0A3S3WGP4_9RHOB|nr:capsular polysaccharide biosynthesis protein [Falsigemmobacter intermedius]